MRTSGLLVLVLFGLGSVCAATDSARLNSPPAGADRLSSDWFDPSAIAHHDFIKLPASDLVDRDSGGFNSKRGGDVTCYTIQNFLVKREPHSDVTVPSGYSTCLPSSKYRVKSAEEPDQASPR